MLSRYREPLRAWTDPIGHLLFRLHLRPNHLTLAGLGVSFVAAAAFMAGRSHNDPQLPEIDESAFIQRAASAELLSSAGHAGSGLPSSAQNASPEVPSGGSLQK